MTDARKIRHKAKMIALYLITVGPVFLFVNVSLALCGLSWEWLWLQIAWIFSSAFADIAKDYREEMRVKYARNASKAG